MSAQDEIEEALRATYEDGVYLCCVDAALWAGLASGTELSALVSHRDRAAKCVPCRRPSARLVLSLRLRPAVGTAIRAEAMAFECQHGLLPADDGDGLLTLRQVEADIKALAGDVAVGLTATAKEGTEESGAMNATPTLRDAVTAAVLRPPEEIAASAARREAEDARMRALLAKAEAERAEEKQAEQERRASSLRDTNTYRESMLTIIRWALIASHSQLREVEKIMERETQLARERYARHQKENA